MAEQYAALRFMVLRIFYAAAPNKAMSSGSIVDSFLEWHLVTGALSYPCIARNIVIFPVQTGIQCY
jgi:hypothetical protein